MAEKKKKLGRPRTRPHPTDPGMLQVICDRMAEGESIVQICSTPDMPEYTAVYRTMAKDEAFATAIAKARAAQQEAEIDKMIQIADEATAETAPVAKLRIWARQWRAAKLAPKKYGDKVQTEIVGAEGGPVKVEQTIKVDPRELSPEARKALADLLSKVVKK